MKITTDVFIQRARKVHGNKYIYLNSVYTRCDAKICITCPRHGDFWQIAKDHTRGHGCPKCKAEKAHKSQVESIKDFVEKARKVHGDKYDYRKVKYYNSQTPVTIICPIHGEFQQKPYSHLAGHGCRKCHTETMFSSTEQFITSAKEIHGNRYDYSKVKYVDSKTPVTIICPEHGEFEQTPNVHLSNHGCPKCKQSHGEKLIYDILKKYKIPFKYQFKLINKYFEQSLLYIDFFVKYKGNQYFIEYNGEQHYRPIKYFGGEEQFKKQSRRDELLRSFCEIHKDKVTLLEIPFSQDEQSIEKTILDFIQFS